ncbi:MAG: hypothetical protein OEY89_13035, partial [Gammaproteobacteria bacterium]|nr:hypothetical protein [Gammaproteobacteria bacterium]
MHSIENQNIVFIALTVILLILLAVVMLVLIDHKSKIPGHFKSDPFSISGIRNEHPIIAFVVTFFLGIIILALLVEMIIVLGSHAGFFVQEANKSNLLREINQSRQKESKRHFHNVIDVDKVDLGKKVVCFQCHGDYPHSQLKMVRTLLNMHTQFLGCMTCHADARKIPENNYQFGWLNYSGIEVTGDHFGTRNDPETGYLIETDDLYSKIVIYDNNKLGDEGLLEITEDNPDVKQFVEMRSTLSDLDRNAIKKHFHKLVMHKGRFCSRCHIDESDSYIPFKALGFSERRIRDITNLNIVGIVEKYRDFYMPRLFDADTSLPGTKTMVGDDKGETKIP